jgi:hypothetical protein
MVYLSQSELYRLGPRPRLLSAAGSRSEESLKNPVRHMCALTSRLLVGESEVNAEQDAGLHDLLSSL